MYYSDKPIHSNGEDQLGRYGFAKLLAQSLLNLNSQDTFTIGLFGKWGSGKTSIVNMMLQEIEILQKNMQDREKLIVVHFEPWNFSSTDQLLTQFFIRLSNELRSQGDKYMEKIGNAIEEYSDAFELLNAFPVFGKALSFFGTRSAVAVGRKLRKGNDENDILKQKEKVTDLLKKQSNRILVVIDDIDRLSNEQIRQVFQLVTSVAKFPNTVYLLVFDRDIVVRALEKVQEGSGDDYLEKIIQMPIQIPEPKPVRLRQVLLDRLNRILSEHPGTGFQKDHWQELYGTCIEPFVDSLRTVNRLSNAVQFKMTSICTEIDFADIVSLSIMELQFPEIYEWIRTNKNVLTGEYDLSTLFNQERTQQEWHELYSSELRALLQQKGADADGNQIEKIVAFISCLFPHFGQKIGNTFEVYDSNLFRKNNQIAHPEKFDRYFSFDLDEIAIKKSELMKATFELDCDEFVEFIKQKENEGISYTFLEELRAMIPDLPSARAKTIVAALLATSYCLDTRSRKSALSLQASDLAEHMVIELLDKVDLTERFQVICDTIACGDAAILQSIAPVINMLELGYGRLAAKGKERRYKKVVTLEELNQLESIFTDKAKQVLIECNLLDFNEWRMVAYLLEQFDADYVKAYLKTALMDDANIVKYIAGSVNEWIGAGTEYGVTDDYKEYLSDERVLQAIEVTKKSGELYSMQEKIQNKCVAFYLNAEGKAHDDLGNIPQKAVDELLTIWKESSQS